MKRILASAIGATLFASGILATDAVFQVSLVPDIALQKQTDNITGVSLNIWGSNQQHAFAIGVINGSYGQSGGLSIGCVNYSENYTGMQWGYLNVVHSDFVGFQIGWVNYTADNDTGLQLGFLNYAGRLKGLQLGLFNMAAQADHGVQVGLLNLLPENRYWFTGGLANEVAPVMVLVNWRF